MEFTVEGDTVKSESEEEELKPLSSVFLPDWESEAGVSIKTEKQDSTESDPFVKTENVESEINPFVNVTCLSDLHSTVIIEPKTEPEEFTVKEAIVQRESEEEELKPLLSVFLPVKTEQQVYEDETAIEGGDFSGRESIPVLKDESVSSIRDEDEITFERNHQLPEKIIDSEPDCLLNINLLTCKFCGKSFNEIEKLKRHLYTHKRIINQFTCETCDKPFSVKGNLKKHQLSHLEIKPFTCNTCGKSFCAKNNLNKHELVHTGVKPFTCETCGKSFSEQGNLNKHKVLHTGNKPFTCDSCGKSFSLKDNLSKHQHVHSENKHSGDKSFLCDTCGKFFAAKECLKKTSTDTHRTQTIHM